MYNNKTVQYIYDIEQQRYYNTENLSCVKHIVILYRCWRRLSDLFIPFGKKKIERLTAIAKEEKKNHITETKFHFDY